MIPDRISHSRPAQNAYFSCLHALHGREKPEQSLDPPRGSRGSLLPRILRVAAEILRVAAEDLPRGGRALVKRLGLGVSKVDWTKTFDFVVKWLHHEGGIVGFLV
jgi:hypothetical protein